MLASTPPTISDIIIRIIREAGLITDKYPVLNIIIKIMKAKIIVRISNMFNQFPLNYP